MLHALTGTRLIAAMSVVFFHYSMVLGWDIHYRKLLGQGRAGVSFFYVLSGFVMAYGYENWFKEDVLRSGEFYRSRLMRIAPLYMFGILLSAIPVVKCKLGYCGVWYPPALHPERMPLTMIGLPLTVVALQSWIPIDAVQEVWNGPGWSVCCEIFFYLLFPLLCLTMVRRSPSIAKLVCWAVGIFAIGALASYGAAWFAITHWTKPPFRTWSPGVIETLEVLYYRFPLVRLPEFAIGVCLGLIYSRSSKRATSVTKTVGMLSLAWLLFLLFSDYFKWILPAGLMGLGRWYPMYVPGFAGIIVYLASSRGLLAKFLETRWMRFGGESSYALYIVHGPIMCFFMTLFPAGRAIRVRQCLLSIACTLVFAGLCHVWIERPLMTRWRQRRSPSPRVPVAMAASAAPSA